MQSKISPKLFLLVTSFVGIIFLTLIIVSINNNKLIAPSQNVVIEKQLDSGLPIKLKIPKINVDSVVEYVGFTAEGRMDVPKNPADVAWYRLGPRPGEVGSSVFAGHSGWGDGTPVVFDNLNKLRKGDKIYVEDEFGLVFVFVVREFRSYDSTADATAVFVSDDGKTHLNLITCEGLWDEVTKSSSGRLVVFTDGEEK